MIVLRLIKRNDNNINNKYYETHQVIYLVAVHDTCITNHGTEGSEIRQQTTHTTAHNTKSGTHTCGKARFGETHDFATVDLLGLFRQCKAQNRDVRSHEF